MKHLHDSYQELQFYPMAHVKIEKLLLPWGVDKSIYTNLANKLFTSLEGDYISNISPTKISLDCKLRGPSIYWWRLVSRELLKSLFNPERTKVIFLKKNLKSAISSSRSPNPNLFIYLQF
jgi:hypothetical protein